MSYFCQKPFPVINMLTNAVKEQLQRVEFAVGRGCVCSTGARLLLPGELGTRGHRARGGAYLRRQW